MLESVTQEIKKKEIATIHLDFINDIVNKKGIFGSVYAALVEKYKTIENANKVVEFARINKLSNIFVKVAFSSDYRELSPNNNFFIKAKEAKAFQVDTWGTEFHEKLDVRDEDTVIIKHRVNALYATKLECILRAQNVKTLIVTGVATDLAVQTLVRDAVDRDFKVIICKDACMTTSNDLQESVLESLSKIAKIITTENLRSDL